MASRFDPHPQQFLPSAFQVPFPIDRFLISRSNRSPEESKTQSTALNNPATPPPETLNFDVVFVGAGPSGLAGAIELARLCQIERKLNGSFPPVEIGVLEKSQSLGGHCLSGAVINPISLLSLFPELSLTDFPLREKVLSDSVYFLSSTKAIPLPTPPTMKNEGNSTLSICELVRWLGQKAEDLGVNIFSGFPAQSLLQNTLGQFDGIRTTPSGLDRDGNPGPQFMQPTDINARYIVLSEGTRGGLTQAFLQNQKLLSRQPQIYALGVKEIWQLKGRSLKSVIHTLGWPLPPSVFGGSFFYPLGNDLVALGIVVGLDYQNHLLDPYSLLQELKTHPLIKTYLAQGELVEWGAKTIPEGGFYSLPPAFQSQNVLLVGDAAGFVNVPSLKGLHYAIESGRLAAQSIFEAIRANNPDLIKTYDEKIRNSFIWSDLYKVRHLRQAFKKGLYWGAIKAGLLTLTGGSFLPNKDFLAEDSHVPRSLKSTEPKTDTQENSKTDAVYYAANKTRDDIPSHLLIGKDIPKPVAEFYTHLCPAGVYELQEDQLIVNAPNCIDCKATDVLGPRWTPREGGSGPNYNLM